MHHLIAMKVVCYLDDKVYGTHLSHALAAGNYQKYRLLLI